MEVSRIIFKKETQEAMEEGLSVRQRGKLLFSRLQELDNNGTLSKAKNRAEQVARELAKWQKQTPILAEEKPTTNPIKVEITRGDMTIKVEMDNHEEASRLITTIMKGE